MIKRHFFVAVTAIITAICLTVEVFSYGITIVPSTAYNYDIVFSGNAVIPEGISLGSGDTITTSLYNGSSVIVSDAKGASQPGSVTSFTMDKTKITSETVNIANVSGVNAVIPSSSYKIQLSVALSKNTVEPSSLLNISSLSVPLTLVLNTGEDEKTTINLSGILSVKIKATKIVRTISSTITQRSFNEGKGFTTRQKKNLLSAVGNITIRATFSSAIEFAQAITLSTNLSGEDTVSTAIFKGDNEVVFSVPKNYIYDSEYESFFSYISFKGAQHYDFSKFVLAFDYDTSSQLYRVSTEKLTINTGANFLLTTNQASFWYASDQSVATVFKGRVTGVSAGTTSIKAFSELGNTVECSINVLESSVPIAALKLSYDKCILRVGKMYTIGSIATPSVNTDVITWISSNPEVASVNASTGKITANAPGTSTIVAVSSSGITASCTVTVKMPQ